MKQRKSLVSQAIEIAGGQTKLALLIGINPRTVRRWVTRDAEPNGLYRAALEKVVDR